MTSMCNQSAPLLMHLSDSSFKQLKSAESNEGAINDSLMLTTNKIVSKKFNFYFEVKILFFQKSILNTWTSQLEKNQSTCRNIIG
jgi:hypothetical protein